MASVPRESSSENPTTEFREPTVVRDPLIGQHVDDYLVRDFVGEGTMGVVYRAVHTEKSQEVVLKILRPEYAEDPTMIARLIQEAQALNSIRHPGIIDILGFGKLSLTGQPYIVMEHASGVTLDTFIRDNAPMSLRVAFPILDQLLSALAAAHAVGVIHRDVKPGNIVLEGPRHARRVKLLDFGLARRDEERSDADQTSARPTNPGSILGTPDFMAPEQVSGVSLSSATDLYAVGGIAYQMLTGRLPHEASSAIDVIVAKMKTPPIPLRAHSPHLGADVEAWVLKLLEKDPDRRPQAAGEARTTLSALVEERGTDPGVGAPVQAPPRAPSVQSDVSASSTIVQLAPLPRESPASRRAAHARLERGAEPDEGTVSSDSRADTGPDSTHLEQTLRPAAGLDGAAASQQAAQTLTEIEMRAKRSGKRKRADVARPVAGAVGWLWAAAGLAILLVFAVIGFLLGRPPSPPQ